MATGSKKLVLLALTANVGIAIIKAIAFAISGSSAMLAESFHSVADSTNQLFLLRGEAASRLAPNARHPFGRGKEAYFWSFMVAVFLFVGGAIFALIEGYRRVVNPHESEAGILFSLVVLGVAAIFESMVAFRPALKDFNKARAGRSLVTTIRESTDTSLIVVLFEDSAAVLGLFIAATGLILADVTGWVQWDGIASILIGLLLASVAWVLAFEMKGLLIGESATRRERSLIRAATLGVPAVSNVSRVLTMQLSPNEILVNMDVELDRELSVEAAERAIDDIEARIRELVPTATRIFVELESTE
ncbi:MAG: cation diffusion facilitator family transporter [Actinobacteria bacterium]|nr:cation diffusion facilitator family transporter [Actinomycetota bacterium]